MSAEERFWAKVNKSAGPDACWSWTAARLKDGYGRFKVGGKVVQAHRFSWELEHGPIPDSLHALHRCDNPPCCNPAHLFLGTHADNMADMAAKGRSGPHLHPERMARGDHNGSFTHPERRARGERHGAHTRPECRPRGERNGSAKLTEAQVDEIRAVYAAGGITQHNLAARFGVSRPQISYIVRGKKWKTENKGERNERSQE